MPHPSFRRPAWLPVAVLAVAVGGTWAAAQPPGFPQPGIPQNPGFPGGPQPNFPQPNFPMPPGGIGGPPPGFTQPGFPGGPPPTTPPGFPGGPNMPQPQNPGNGANIPGGPGGFGDGGPPNFPQAGLNPPGGGMNGQVGRGNEDGGMVQVWVCEKCKHQWPKVAGTTPTKCPNCGVQFGYITNADGSKSVTTSGVSSIARKWVYIVGGVLVLVAAGVGALIKLLAGGAKPKRKVKRKVRRPARDDDDD